MSARNRKCAVNLCGSTQKRNPKIGFTQFPPYHSLRFKQWCKITQLVLSGTRHFICHKHFINTDFFKNKMLYHAIPSIHLGNYEGSNGHIIEVSDDTSNQPLQYKPFNCLLKNVVFTISGLQSSVGITIRKKAREMGAKFKQVWDNNCTHLICAFKNTPKYNQVRGHGKIVKKDWILNCYTKRKRLHWRKFALDENEASGIYSDDEILDITLKPKDTEINLEKEKIPTLEKTSKSPPIIDYNCNHAAIDDDVEIIDIPIEEYIISSDDSESDDI